MGGAFTRKGAGGGFLYFNCLTFEFIDEEKSEKEYFGGEEVGVKKIAFDEKAIGEKLAFKTSYNACIELYCGEKLKTLVSDLQLTGIVFIPI